MEHTLNLGVKFNESFGERSFESVFSSSGKNFLLLHVNRKREKKFRLRWRRALDGIDFARCSCSTLIW